MKKYLVYMTCAAAAMIGGTSVPAPIPNGYLRRH